MIREKISTHSKTNLSFSHIYCNRICMLHSIIIMTSSLRVITGYCSLLQSNNYYCPIVEAMIDKYIKILIFGDWRKMRGNSQTQIEVQLLSIYYYYGRR